MLPQPVLALGAFSVFEHLAKRGLADVKISVSLQVFGFDFLVCDVGHWLASCCSERIMPANKLVTCARRSTGMVPLPPEGECVSVSKLAHSDQACIQVVIPLRRNSARPRPRRPEMDWRIAS